MLSKSHTKDIQSLHHKKFRDEQGLFIAEGPKVIMDLLKGGKYACKEVLAQKEWLSEHLRLREDHPNTVFTEVTDFELEKIAALSTPHQVLAVFSKHSLPEHIYCKGKLTLVLDSIQDPGNLGTIIRIADWFGIKQIVCSLGCADQYNPKVVQSTMGSLGRVQLLYTDLQEFLTENTGIPVYAAMLDGKAVQQFNKIREGILIIGNESRGISAALLELVKEKITIPRKGEADSLNAAVATGILLSFLA